jgi:hypothetical protein
LEIGSPRSKILAKGILARSGVSKKGLKGWSIGAQNLPNAALSGDQNQTSMPLEVLNSSFVLLGGLARHERSEILSLASPWIFLSRVQAVLSGL